MAEYTLYIDKDTGSAGTTWAQVQVAETPADTILGAITLARANTSAADVINLSILAAATDYNDTLSFNNINDDGRTWNLIGTNTPNLIAPVTYNVYIDCTAVAFSFTGIAFLNTIVNNAASVISIIDPTPNITLTDCNIDSSTSTGNYAFPITGGVDSTQEVVLSGCRITTGDDVFQLSNDLGKLRLLDCTITSGTPGGFSLWPNTGWSRWERSRCVRVTTVLLSRLRWIYSSGRRRLSRMCGRANG